MSATNRHPDADGHTTDDLEDLLARGFGLEAVSSTDDRLLLRMRREGRRRTLRLPPDEARRLASTRLLDRLADAAARAGDRRLLA